MGRYIGGHETSGSPAALEKRRRKAVELLQQDMTALYKKYRRMNRP